MQIGVVLEGVEAPADDMDRAAMRDAADMVARAGQRLAHLPSVGLGIVDLVPADAGALGRRGGRAADQIDPAVQHHCRAGAARPRQRCDRVPAIRGDIVGEGLVVGRGVLQQETAERIDAAAIRCDRDVVGAARQRRARQPRLGGGIEDMIEGAIDPALAVAADDVEAVAERGRPGHLAARQRQRRPRFPAALRALRRGTVGDALGFLLGRDVMRRAAVELGVGLGRGRGGRKRGIVLRRGAG